MVDLDTVNLLPETQVIVERAVTLLIERLSSSDTAMVTFEWRFDTARSHAITSIFITIDAMYVYPHCPTTK